MNIVEYARILMRRGWILVLLAGLIGGGSYFLTRNQTPVYRATQLVLIQPSRPDLGLAEASIRLLNSSVVYLDSDQRAQEIIDDLQWDTSAGALRGMTTFQADTLRLTIQIDVDSTDQAFASQVASAWGEMLREYRDELNQSIRREDRVEALLTDFPRISQTAPRPTFSAIAGALLGLIIGGVIVFILEFIESSVVRRGDDVERALGLTVLATIPDFDA